MGLTVPRPNRRDAFCPLGACEGLCALAMLHVIVREPGTIYNGYWFFSRPTMEDLRQDLRAVTKKTGTSQRPSSKKRGNKAARNSSIPTVETHVQTLGEQD